jgi:branched-chain amino acid transport system ATP-binding protein
MLEVRGLSIRYGGIHALKGISLGVRENQIVALIGSNGAGKSTTLRAISGLAEGIKGKIIFRGREIQSLPAHTIARSGITLVPEGRHIFANLTVKENLLMGAFARRAEEEIREDLNKTLQLFPRLKIREKQKGGTLSGGEQQMLALGRGLMSRPVLLMLDEPSLGLAPKLVDEVFEIIRKIHREGATLLLVEQNAVASLGVSDYGYVLRTGQISLEGTGNELLKNPSVKEAYLGKGGSAS